MMVLFKFVHVAAIALWSAGLIALPVLYVQRRGLAGEPLHRLHGFTRFLYVNMLSPAAFAAVLSGTVLVFLREVHQPWFTAKLALVGVMVLIHVTSGLVILRLFEPSKVYPRWRMWAVLALSTLVVGGILVLVLAKPALELPGRAGEIFRPGALGEWGGALIDRATR